ncbi:MFS transporter [Weissella confusa]|uniref:MFS transporter n=1 Tax=Weissella confusa TaxID=1583 RepID=UPI0021BE5765|nr:MFS transporter [Weissella confusa]MCT8392871.1 MFS transporter [Weissella confusa]
MSKLVAIRMQVTIYLMYVVQGFALIILAQTMSSLTSIWHTNLAGATAVVSAIGIGKLIAYPFLGELSDRWPRKTLLLLAMAAYGVFFTLVPVSTQIWQGIVLTSFAGIANSMLDAVAYPTLLALHEGRSSGNVLIKAMISIGEGILPVIIINLNSHQLWFGWVFWVASAILIIVFLILIGTQIPEVESHSAGAKAASHWQWDVVQFTFLAYGFTAMWLMIHFTQWVTRYFQLVRGFDETSAHLLMTCYSVGSLIGVGLVFLLTGRRLLPEKWLLVVMNSMALLSLIMLLVVNTNSIFLISMSTVMFGMSAAGGALQLGVGQLIAHNPTFTGRATGWYFFSGSIAALLMPIVTGHFAEQHLAVVMQSLLIVAVINLFLVVSHALRVVNLSETEIGE